MAIENKSIRAVARTGSVTCILRLFGVLMLLLYLVGSASASEISGTVVLTVGPYILLENDGSKIVVRVDKETAYGNLEGLGSLKQGGDEVAVNYDRIISGVLLATAVTKKTTFVPSPERFISVEQLAIDLAAGKVIVVDPRSVEKWNEGHIPGALLSPTMESLKERFNDLDKRSIVFYGTSPGDILPFSAARNAAENGIMNIKILSGGISYWRKGGKVIACDQSYLANLRRKGLKFRLLDVRNPAAASPVIPGAEEVPLPSLAREKVFLPQRSYQLPLFLYGPEEQTMEAARQILAWGYHHDGDVAVVKASNPAGEGNAKQDAMSPLSVSEEEISFDEFRSLWQKGDPNRILLNVKPDRDRKAAGELHIPLENLPERISEIPKDREVVIYCKLGIRSSVAFQILKGNGYKVRYMNRILTFGKTGNVE